MIQMKNEDSKQVSMIQSLMEKKANDAICQSSCPDPNFRQIYITAWGVL